MRKSLITDLLPMNRSLTMTSARGIGIWEDHASASGWYYELIPNAED